MSIRSLSKFRGCLLGGLIGDCIGSPFEGDKVVGRGALLSYFNKLLTTDKSSRSLQIYGYTDDTAMMKSVAGSLIANNGFDAHDMAKRFTEEYFKSPKRGYGSTVIDIFSTWNMMSEERDWKDMDIEEVFEPAKQSFNGCGSAGNGAGMRVSPVSLFCHAKGISTEELVTLVRQSSQLTHSHPLGFNGAILQALAVKKGLETEVIEGQLVNTSSFLDEIIAVMRPIEENTPEITPVKTRSGDRIKRSSIEIGDSTSKTPYTDKLVEMKLILEDETQGSDLSPEEIIAKFGNSVLAFRSVPTAVYCALRSMKKEQIKDYPSDNPFLKCLFLSISLGGDTDTIACMACSIIGAVFGETIIDEILKKRSEFSQETIEIAVKMGNN